MYQEMLNNVVAKSPLVHCITNYVTVNDCANILLACGAQPIMADDIAEVAEITSICNALVINIGTLNARTIESMICAGKAANQLGKPVILDPVGAGASALRTETVARLLAEVRFAVIRGNISEIKTVYFGSGTTKGVDADINDRVTENNVEEIVVFAKKLSQSTGAVIAITGVIDIVANATQAYIIRNGHTMMAKVTGTGCMLSAVIGGYCGANKDNCLEATATAVVAMGLCGEIAYQKVLKSEAGNGSYRMYIMDAMYRMEADILKAGIQIESRG